MNRYAMRPTRLCLLALLFFCLAAQAQQRPDHWAQPVEIAGLPNLHQITPMLYRGAQPSRVGTQQLAELGIKTVINLRNFHSDKKRLRDTGIKLFEMDINTWKIGDRDVVRVLKLLRNQEAPLLIHCQHGADRTGLMSAMYRIVEQGWTKQAALEEMTRGGYGFHRTWKNIIRYIEQVDIERIRAAIVAD